jgi:hypothetical protein
LLSINKFFTEFNCFIILEQKIHFSLYDLTYFLTKQILKSNKNKIKKKIERTNTFNFKKLTKKKNYLRNKNKYGILKLNSNNTTILYHEIVNFFLCNCYFQKFKIIFYPGLGILFYFEKKIFIFKKFYF